jgi:hypothetical protein
MLECAMSGKSKGGREVRKPKQAKTPKVTEPVTLLTKGNANKRDK